MTTRRKHESTGAKDTAALAIEAARLEAKKALDDSGAVESAALSDVALTDADVTAVGEPPVNPLTEADIIAETPEPKPAWVTAAKTLCPRASDANGAWHDYFKAPLPSAPKEQWTGPTATYSYYEGGKVLVAYRSSGFFAVMMTPPLEKQVRPGRR